MTALALESLLLGLVFCATPGVIAAEAMRRGLARGFRAALALQFGSLLGDAVWAVSALAGGAVLVRTGGAREVIGLLGGGLLLYLAIAAFRDAFKGAGTARTGDAPASSARVRPKPGRGDFGIGAALSLGNPFAVAFWLGVGTSVVSARFTRPGLLEFAVFLAGVTAGGIVWSFVFAGAVAVGRRYLTPAFFRAADACCGAVLAWFAVNLVRRTLF